MKEIQIYLFSLGSVQLLK